MDESPIAAPPVVAVVVTHEPGPWFEDLLNSLARQDYPNLTVMVLIAETDDGITGRVKAALPTAHVRLVPENLGFGVTANAALHLVEGSGLFCFLHDDVALDSDAITRLVEELYRSNAGIVGPKLVDWDDPRVLQNVGLGVDRFGEVDSALEPDEIDQEQHDAVEDVFCVPSACVVIRADLFRALGGFCEQISYQGDDLDLCWRAHLNGARVLVVPTARVRHRHALAERRPDLASAGPAAHSRLFTVATLSGGWRLPGLFIETLVLSIIETVVGLFTGRLNQGLASLRAIVALPLRLPAIVVRRRQVKPLRLVPDGEVVGLQVRGSARLASFRRHRQHAAAAQRNSLPFRRRAGLVGTGKVLRTVVVLLVLFGSRTIISKGLPVVGQFVPLQSPRVALRAYLSGWNMQGFGSSSASPTAVGLLGIAGFVTFGKVALLRTLLIIVPIAVGYFGMWRLADVVPSTRARAIALAVYAAIPLPYTAIAAGRWNVIACYAAMPWVLDLLRRVSGVGAAADLARVNVAVADVVVHVERLERVRLAVALAVVVAMVSAFAPAFAFVVVVAAAVVAIATVIAGGSRSMFIGLAAAIAALLITFVLHIPWSATLLRAGGWRDVVAGGINADSHLGLVRVAGFGLGRSTLGLLVLALYAPVVIAPLIGRGWRLSWAARGSLLAVGFAGLAALSDGGHLPWRLPEAGILLAPAACGIALAAAAAAASLELDVIGARFGWRQPLGVLVSLGIAAGLLPTFVATFNGAWFAHRSTIGYLRQLPAADVAGNYRTLFIGDPRLLPTPSRPAVGGVSYAVVDDGALAPTSQFLAPETGGDALVAEALGLMRDARSEHAGRLLAPLGVRYLVIPVNDHTGSAAGTTPDALASGLLDAMTAQLDFRVVGSTDEVRVFENTAWLPVTATLDPAAAQRSNQAGLVALVGDSPGSGTAVFVNARAGQTNRAAVTAGTVLLATTDSPNWHLTVAGREVARRGAYGWAMAFDVPAAGPATLAYRTPSTRRLLIVGQFAAWVLAALFVAALRPGLRRRRVRHVAPLPAEVLHLDEIGVGPVDFDDDLRFSDDLRPPASPIRDVSANDPGLDADRPSDAVDAGDPSSLPPTGVGDA
jgi:GT2 family glycosyltransferase